MHFGKMVELIQKKYEISVLNQVNYRTIMDVVYINDGPISWNDHTLYIGNLSKLEPLPNHPIMLLNTNHIPFENMWAKKSCLGIIQPKEVQRVYQMAKDILYEALKSQAILFKVAQAALQGKDIISLIDIAASLMGNALILVDSNMKVLVHSTSLEIMDPLWADNIERGHYSYEFMQRVKSNEDMQGWNKSGEESRIITLEGDKQPKLVTRITKEGHIVGALVMIAHHTPIKPSHIKLLPQIGEILFQTFNSGINNGMHNSFYGTILFHLLSGDELPDTFQLMPLSKSDFPSKMFVVVARFVHRIRNRYIKRTLGVKLEAIFPNGHLVYYKNYVGMLVPSISIKQKEKLEKLVVEENINAGISWPFTNILDFKKYFYQAVTSIKQAQSFGKTNKVLVYTDYSFYDLLFNYEGKISLKNYCHPALETLKKYDNTNKTELYITLKTFLNLHGNRTATAEALFLHRNSVNYRINQIIEITGLDLDDINTIYSLIDSFRIENFIETMDILDL